MSPPKTLRGRLLSWPFGFYERQMRIEIVSTANTNTEPGATGSNFHFTRAQGHTSPVAPAPGFVFVDPPTMLDFSLLDQA